MEEVGQDEEETLPQPHVPESNGKRKQSSTRSCITSWKYLGRHRTVVNTSNCSLRLGEHFHCKLFICMHCCTRCVMHTIFKVKSHNNHVTSQPRNELQVESVTRLISNLLRKQCLVLLS